MILQALLLLALSLSHSEAQDACLAHGTHGLPGHPGRDGRDGSKGQKGDSGLWSTAGVHLKGEPGVPGPQGHPGKRGAGGDPGQTGVPGVKGEPGQPGDPGEASKIGQGDAAFSVARGTVEYPDRTSVVRFSKVFTNLHEDYSTQTGRFRCRVPGTYYFVYHASTDNNLCLKMKLDDTVLALFCDHRRKQRQVTSGGVAVYMSQDQEVYLETTDYRSMRGQQFGYSVFSGFLLQAH